MSREIFSVGSGFVRETNRVVIMDQDEFDREWDEKARAAAHVTWKTALAVFFVSAVIWAAAILLALWREGWLR